MTPEQTRKLLAMDNKRPQPSRAEMAEELGVTQSCISKIINAHRNKENPEKSAIRKMFDELWLPTSGKIRL